MLVSELAVIVDLIREIPPIADVKDLIQPIPASPHKALIFLVTAILVWNPVPTWNAEIKIPIGPQGETESFGSFDRRRTWMFHARPEQLTSMLHTGFSCLKHGLFPLWIMVLAIGFETTERAKLA